jgi:hypothetical protein
MSRFVAGLTCQPPSSPLVNVEILGKGEEGLRRGGEVRSVDNAPRSWATWRCMMGGGDRPIELCHFPIASNARLRHRVAGVERGPARACPVPLFPPALPRASPNASEGGRGREGLSVGNFHRRPRGWRASPRPELQRGCCHPRLHQRPLRRPIAVGRGARARAKEEARRETPRPA